MDNTYRWQLEEENVSASYVVAKKTYFGGLKAYLRATDHTSSNIISRDLILFIQ
jgi:hypothetical protein